MDFIFTPEHIVVNDLLGNDIRYIIPEYQRPYSWDCLGKNERNNQVNVMWDDLLNFYDREESGEYFFGSMVMIDKGNRQFEVIDGQQRLTTLVILFVALKCFLLDLKNDSLEGNKEVAKFLEEAVNEIDNLVFNKEKFGLIPEKKVKIEKISGFDYDKILQTTMECGSYKTIKNATKEQIDTSLKYFSNRNYLKECIKKKFVGERTFGIKEAQALDKFTRFLKNRVSIVRIKTPNFNIAYHIFEILNNRGLPLSTKDLFKNFLIKEFDRLKESNSKDKQISPVNKWIELEENKNFDDAFLGRWVESKNASQEKFSIFNDLLEIYNRKYEDSLSKKKIELLHEDLLTDLAYYSYIANPEEIVDRTIRNKVLFLMNAGNLRYTANLLLSLFRCLKYQGDSNSELLDFLKVYEKYVIFIQLAPFTRFSNTPVYKAIDFLNRAEFNFAKIELRQEARENHIEEWLKSNIYDNQVAKLLIAKYFWHQDAKNQDVIEQTLLFDKATLEHIIPQTPKRDSNWNKDFKDKFRSDYTYRLGNMTLLTSSMNSAAKNSDFATKKKEYAKTKLFLTQQLVLIEKIDEEFIKKRHNEIVKGILEDLDL